MTELEKACEELTKELISNFAAVCKKHNRDFDEPECLIIEDTVKATFKEALKPEHMKLTEEVKGLIKACEMQRLEISYLYEQAGSEVRISKADPEECSVAKAFYFTNQALKPFEKEN